MDNLQKDKILAAHFAATHPSESTADFEAFVHHIYDKGEYDQLKLWWDDMDALRVIRAAEHYIRNLLPEAEQSSDLIEELDPGKNGIIQLKEKPIGKIYNYHRTVLPQEMQIRLAYDTLIERFVEYLQKNKYAIRLSENQLTFVLFVPDTDFHLEDEWQKFIQFAYSEEELYKSFVLFVNNSRLSNKKGGILGYVRFPSVTEAMRNWQAAFYIATLRRRVLKPDKANEPDSEERRTDKREELKRILFELSEQLQPSELKLSFSRAEVLSWQFNTTGSSQVKSAESEKQIHDILTERLYSLPCLIATVGKIKGEPMHTAGDRIVSIVKARCYSCGRNFSPKTEGEKIGFDAKKFQANSFVFSAPSQRLMSGTGEERPRICPGCLTISFASPIKLVKGVTVVQLFRDENSQPLSTEKYLQMLTLGELNLIAGRYLLIKCTDFVSERGGPEPVSEKIGQIQYALWRVAQTLPTEALEGMNFTLFAGESKIQLSKRWLVWLSHLNESFKPRLIVNGKDNKSLCQAIRLIQKDEVISAIYKLVTAEYPEVIPLHDRSYSEKRSLEELRKKHCDLLEQSSKGDKLMSKQGDFYRDVAALTGLTYAYCDSVRRLLVNNSKISDKDVQIEVKKLIEDVTNPTGFTYRAAKEFADKKYSDTSAIMVRKNDNYFCYDQAKRLLKDVLELDISNRKNHDDNGQESLKVYYDDILNAYAKLSDEYDKAEWRKLATELKQNLYAKFPFLFRKETNQNGN